jgi:dihydrofolate reductase
MRSEPVRKFVYLVATSLDGRIAGPNGEIDFFPLAEDVADHLRSHLPDTLPTHVRSAMGVTAPNLRFDTVVMGRRTYEPALAAGITSPYRHLRQYVVSRGAAPVPDPEVTFVDDPISLVRALKQEHGLDIWLCGGGNLAGTLLPEIDELVVKHYPVLAGTGLPVLDGHFAPRRLTVEHEQSFRDGTRLVTYRPPRGD